MRHLNLLFLPPEQTAFELQYLRRTNWFAMLFALANLPLIVGVAWANSTGALLAVVLTLVVIGGPALAMVGLRNQRTVSLTFGVASMCLGGLLVHFGQGPMQIEMHFYFFSALAMLAAFGNPMVIIAAAVTVTLHHTVIWALLPASVFNYDASMWVVAVHATFVLVESVVACGIARSFFDNVIGLEKVVRERTAELDERNAQMRVVLDTVAQGFLTVKPDLQLNTERSAAVGKLLGSSTATSFLEYVRGVDAEFAGWLEVGWDEVQNGFLPREITLDQLPKVLRLDGRTLEVGYQPIDGTDDMLIVLTDITDRLAKEQAENEQRELLTSFQHFLSDKAGFLAFFMEGDAMVRSLPGEMDLAIVKRKLHTLKGNAAVFGFMSLSRLIHTMESELDEVGGFYAARMQARLEERWRWIRESVERVVDDRSVGIEMTSEEYASLLETVDHGSRAELLQLVESLRLHAGSQTLERMAYQGRTIARGLGKDVAFEVEANGVRLDREYLQQFWSAFVHVVRNALDHGVECPDERTAKGKPTTAVVRLSLAMVGSDLVVEAADDGAGIDWDRVRSVAASKGLPHDSQEELTAVLFHDGLTTRYETTEYSGRGVGLAAVFEEVERLGGRIEVESRPDEGTRLRFVLPSSRGVSCLAIAV